MIILAVFLLVVGIVGIAFGCRLWGDRDYFLCPLMGTIFLVAGILLIGVGVNCFSGAFVDKNFLGSESPPVNMAR